MQALVSCAIIANSRRKDTYKKMNYIGLTGLEAEKFIEGMDKYIDTYKVYIRLDFIDILPLPGTGN